jgi:chaperonin GroEL (HSP60 family)
LINKHVHPSVIVDGYDAASEQALKLLQKTAVKVDVKDKELLMKIAMTSMYSKLVSEDSPVLSKIVVEAAKQVSEKGEQEEKEQQHKNGDYRLLKVDLDNIKVEKKAGGSIHDTQLGSVEIIDFSPDHSFVME